MPRAAATSAEPTLVLITANVCNGYEESRARERGSFVPQRMFDLGEDQLVSIPSTNSVHDFCTGDSARPERQSAEQARGGILQPCQFSH